MKPITLCFTAALMLAPVFALSEEGTLNPLEMAISNAPHAKPSIAVCSSGYYLNKKGDHSPALIVHKNCAEAGYTRSMLWLAYIYQNGYDVSEDPEKVAYWDRRAAKAGNEVGMFNYGLDLLRGYGVARNIRAGRSWIDRAAAGGHKHAKILRDSGYDLRIVTPDTDEKKFE